MTNEEIIQQGGEDILTRLWVNNKAFIIRQAYRWRNVGQVELDDLIQCGFLAVADTVKHYDPTSGAFITLLNFYIKKHFAECCASSSGWTVAQWCKVKDIGIKVDSINRRIYTDNGDSAELGDFIPDPEDKIAGLIDQFAHNALHDELEKMLRCLKSEEECIIRLRYYKDLPIEKISIQLNLPLERCRSILRSAFKHLRKMAVKAKLEEYIDIHTNYYAHVGVERFQNTGTSAVELIVMRREEMRNSLLHYID